MATPSSLIRSLCKSSSEKQRNKIKCIIHYFERISSTMPLGYVSFERKVLPMEHNPPLVTYPTAYNWANSTAPLCRFEEEIRFMINPELIAGMLFLPSMLDNEAIEIVGVERFSNYTGYAATFRYSGNHVDEREADSLGRRVTRIVAIDAMRNPGSSQYRLECILREVNKALCGFLSQPKYESYEIQDKKRREGMWDNCNVGVATGNWGCGAYGGDPQLKALLQWLAASQALRPFILYYTFGLEQLQYLNQGFEWIVSQKWSVRELWNMLLDYCSKRAKGETKLGFFSWLIPTFDSTQS